MAQKKASRTHISRWELYAQCCRYGFYSVVCVGGGGTPHKMDGIYGHSFMEAMPSVCLRARLPIQAQFQTPENGGFSFSLSTYCWNGKRQYFQREFTQTKQHTQEAHFKVYTYLAYRYFPTTENPSLNLDEFAIGKPINCRGGPTVPRTFTNSSSSQASDDAMSENDPMPTSCPKMSQKQQTSYGNTRRERYSRDTRQYYKGDSTLPQLRKHRGPASHHETSYYVSALPRRCHTNTTLNITRQPPAVHDACRQRYFCLFAKSYPQLKPAVQITPNQHGVHRSAANTILSVPAPILRTRRPRQSPPLSKPALTWMRSMSDWNWMGIIQPPISSSTGLGICSIPCPSMASSRKRPS